MSDQSWLQFFIDWMGLPALAALAVLLIYRKWYRPFPFFVFYVIVAESVGIIRLISMRQSPSTYPLTYWISDAALAVVAFLATYELFIKRLFPNFHRNRFYQYIFPATAICLTVLAMSVALHGGHSSLFAKTVRIYAVLRVAILFFFVALMLFMGRLWDKQEFGIAFGFGLDVATSLAFLGILSQSFNQSAMLNRLSVIAYDIACIVWLYCFWPKPAASISAATDTLTPQALQEARKWEKDLKDFITHKKR